MNNFMRIVEKLTADPNIVGEGGQILAEGEKITLIGDDFLYTSDRPWKRTLVTDKTETGKTGKNSCTDGMVTLPFEENNIKCLIIGDLGNWKLIPK